MASFTIYDPKTKEFRAVETASESDLPFEQVLLINILLELRVLTEYLGTSDIDRKEEPDDVRASLVQESGSI